MIALLMGQYHHGNQPSHHIAYLYVFAGEAWKTQMRVREIMTRLYRDTPAGLCGDEDNGEMSAWFVLSAMGFYPVCPSRPVYAIGSPLFQKMTIRPLKGKPLVIEAIKNSPRNVYVQSVKYNGAPLSEAFITHGDIAAGGRLEFEMGSAPKPQ